ncbi:ABC transporter, partial [Georgenia thermotolerans]
MGVVTAQPDVTTEVDPPEAPAPRSDVLADLEAEVARTRFPLDLPGAADLRALREQVLTQLGTRLLPRLQQPTAPAVVVLGGSSGAGKSTLLNSVVGAEVSAAGVLRPTTRRPVVAVHPADAPAVQGQPLAELAEVVVHDGVPEGLALLDAPDLDSVHAPNRALGVQLLETADLWVFVTTAARYGDAIPWRTLTEAESRGITTAVVLNRVPAGVLAPVRADLLARMDGLGLGSAPLFLIPDVGPHEGPLPAERVAELGGWLRLVARRPQSVGVVRRTTRRGWASLREELFALATGADDQVEALAALRAGTERAPDAAVTAVLGALREGRA